MGFTFGVGPLGAAIGDWGRLKSSIIDSYDVEKCARESAPGLVFLNHLALEY